MNAHPSLAAVRAERARAVARVLWLTLALNWLVALLKFSLGAATQSMMIIADGVHSLSDGLANIVGLIGIWISGRPADESHPYGHQKYETLTALLIAVFLCVAAAGIVREAVVGLFHPRIPEVGVFSFAVMGFTLAVNVFVVVYESRKARELKSELLQSDSWHTFSDVVIGLSVILALVGIRARLIPGLDSIVSLALGSFVVLMALNILKKSSDVLSDRAALDTRLIEAVVRRVEGIRDCHEIRTRGRADDVYIDLHVLVDPEMTVFDSHHLANILENSLRKEFPSVHDVIVHVEPLSHGHDEIETPGAH